MVYSGPTWLVSLPATENVVMQLHRWEPQCKTNLKNVRPNKEIGSYLTNLISFWLMADRYFHPWIFCHAYRVNHQLEQAENWFAARLKLEGKCLLVITVQKNRASIIIMKQTNLGKNCAINFCMLKNQEFPPPSGRTQKGMSWKLLWWWIIHYRELLLIRKEEINQQLLNRIARNKSFEFSHWF